MKKAAFIILIVIFIISLAIGVRLNLNTREGLVSLDNEYLNMLELPIDSNGTVYLQDGYYNIKNNREMSANIDGVTTPIFQNEVNNKLMAKVPPGYKITPDKNGIYKEGADGVYPIPCDNAGICSVPNGYYQIGTTDTMSVIPYGFQKYYNNAGNTVSSGITLSPAISLINGPLAKNSPTSNLADADKNSLIKYDSNNFDLKYHDDIEMSRGLDDLGSPSIYYQPGAFKYGGRTYVPNYEESVHLSKNTMFPRPRAIAKQSESSDFCEKNKNFPDKIESACNNLSNDGCKKSSCCVLLGGEKCVAGSELGPAYRNNYSDFTIRNRDYYFYNGRCYGNCPYY
jgi:hypothetical protein